MSILQVGRQLTVIRTCRKSPDGRKRYELARAWDASLPGVTFIGANPSLADDIEDDATVRKWLGFARRLGYGSFAALNLEPWIATNPKALRDMAPDVVDKPNQFLLGTITGAVIVCWGDCLQKRHAAHESIWLLKNSTALTVQCWGRTARGNPKHPLMLSYSTPLEPWP